MKYKILITGALLINAYFMQSCNDAGKTSPPATEMDSSMNHSMPSDSMNSGMMNSDGGMMQSMNNMMNKMHAMEISGDFDHDFANMMMMHHQGAIDMSELENAKGTNTQIKTMAQSIITAQKTEIAQMQQLIKDHKMPEAKQQPAELHKELTASMNKMMDNMSSVKMMGNTDMDYVMMMIPHHEAAVKMAEAEISYGKQAALKQMAKKMIIDQNKEIKELRDWLAQNK